MPKKVNVSSNQRLDLEDFDRAASDYSQESDNFGRQKLTLSGRSVVSSGFRIELSDQATSPGEFTIYNGVGVDRSGNVLNNEQQLADSRVITLNGTGLPFYIEVEYVETESDVDARAFWDPTFAGNNPPGKEFSLNVATRLTPDWQVVQPISTTQFSITGDASSARTPIAVLTTDGSNQITGVTAVNASSVLEEDVVATATTVRVLDSTIFPSSGVSVIVGFGSGTTDTVTLTANDRTNGILTVSPALANSYEAGDIVIVTGTTATFLPESKDSVPASGEDRRRRMFAGDEVRGSALSADPQDAALRSDLNIASLKDEVDFLAAQLRELKFGSLRSDETSTAPPSSFASTRYYDAAGSVTGARNFAVSVGDGTNSFGDFNNSVLGTALAAAVAALDATDGGSVYVKNGTYTWGSSALSVDRPLTLEFDKGAVFGAGTYTNFDVQLAAGHAASSIKGFPAPPSGEDAALLSGSAVPTQVVLEDSYFRLSLTGTGSNSYLKAYRSIFEGYTTAVAASFAFDTAGDTVVFEDCTFRYNDTVADTNSYLVSSDFADAVFSRCVFDLAYNTASTRGFLFAADMAGSLTVSDCKFIDTNTGVANAPIDLGEVTQDKSRVTFEDCIFDVNWDSSAATTLARTLLTLHPAKLVVRGCDFSAIGENTIGNTSAGNLGAVVYSQCKNAVITENVFGDPTEIADVPHYVADVWVDYSSGSDSSAEVSSNQFKHPYRGVYCAGTSDLVNVVISNNVFHHHSTSLTKDVTAIYVEEAAQLTAVGNTVDFLCDGGTGSLHHYGIHYLDTFGSTKSLINNNHIKILAYDDAGTGIFADDDGMEVSVVGNYVEVDSDTAQPSVGIHVIVDSFAPIVNIATNTLEVSHSGSSFAYGIQYAPKSAVGSYNGTQSITGNKIDLNCNTTSASDAAGIHFEGLNGLISNNSIYFVSDNPLNVGDLGSAIYAEGHNVQISNNVIKSNSSGCDASIKAVTQTASANNGEGNWQINGNNIQHNGASPAIVVDSQQADLHVFSVCNNNIRWDGPGSYTTYAAQLSYLPSVAPLGICFATDNSQTHKSIILNQNNIHIAATPSSAPLWKGIYVYAVGIGEGGTDDIQALSISFNVITSIYSLTAMSTAARAIQTVTGSACTCIGNIIYDWTGAAQQTTLELFDGPGGTAVVGNVLYNIGTGGLSTSMNFGSSTGVAVGNSDRDGDGTLGGSKLLSNGTYNDLV